MVYVLEVDVGIEKPDLVSTAHYKNSPVIMITVYPSRTAGSINNNNKDFSYIPNLQRNLTSCRQYNYLDSKYKISNNHEANIVTSL